MTASEKAGVKAIIELQGVAGIKETEAQALAGWRGMSAHEREQTLLAHRAVVGGDPNIAATPKKRKK